MTPKNDLNNEYCRGQFCFIQKLNNLDTKQYVKGCFSSTKPVNVKILIIGN